MMATRKPFPLFYGLLGLILIGLSVWFVFNAIRPSSHFDGSRAYQDVLSQVSFGARTPGSIAHTQDINYIQQELEKAGWKIVIQSTEWQGFSIQNIIASRSEIAPQIVIGAHYDSRLLADQEKGNGENGPVPGANDGASGVAILLELSRTLPLKSVPVWLVFFDAEDNGGIDNRQWIMGSRAFVSMLTEKPQSAIIVDMVGDSDLNIFMEGYSNTVLSRDIWAQANALGYGNNFIPTIKYYMLDDHTPFFEAGIPTVDIIDFDYPYWHTSTDTADKVSAHSLQVVGETLLEWIKSQK
jgi:glutaminyl-peptide cyclotransferase